MIAIASAQNPTIKRVRSLAEKKFRQAEKLFVAEGAKVLDRAREQGWEPDILLTTGPHPPWGNAAIIEVTPEVMAKVSAQSNPPERLAVFGQRWAERVAPQGLWLALEDIRDPGNLGTIIRTADAAGATGIVLAGQCCDPWGPDCVRATMGSVFAVPLVSLEVAGLIALCREWPGETVGTLLKGTEDYRRPYGAPTLILIGSEGRGLSEALAAACSTLVRIPMRAGIDSLNVSIATALMLFEARRATL